MEPTTAHDALLAVHATHKPAREDCPLCQADARIDAQMADLLAGRVPSRRLA